MQCQKEDDTTVNNNHSHENKDSNVTAQRVDAGDIPDIIEFVRSKSSPSLTFKFSETNYAAAPGGGGTINHEDDLTMTQVMTDQIEMVTENNLTNYAFDVESSNDDYFLNLIVSEVGCSQFMYFIKYVKDPNADELGLLGFTGTMYYYSEAGVFKMSTTVTNGVINDNCPCDEDGGGGDGTGDGGGSNGCTWTVQWLCDWANVYHDARTDCNCPTGTNPCGGTYVISLPPGCTGNTSINPDINSTSNTCPCGPDESDDTGGSSGGGTGGGSGTPSNNCSGVAPCGELEQYDENCNCVPATPLNIVPINNSEVTEARQRIKNCIGMEQSSFWNDDANWAETLAISEYIEAKGCSLDNQEFIEIAIEAWSNEGEVDFENEIIIDSSIPTCVKNIINDLINDDAYLDLSEMPDLILQELNLSGFILNLFKNSENFKLVFKSDSLTTTTSSGTTYRNASTDPNRDENNPGKFIFTITIDDSYISNATDLAIARTVIHESVHAYISYLYQTEIFASLSQAYTTLLSQMDNNIDSAQHMLMATNFVYAISNSLANWDNNSITDSSYYNYMSWSGDMLTTSAFTNMSTDFQQNAIDANVAEGNAGPLGTYNSSDAKGTKNCN